MFDFGFAELIFIAVITIFVIGPKEMPVVMLTLGRVFRRLQYMRFAVGKQFDDFMRESEMKDIGASVNFEARDKNFDEAAADEDYIDVPQIDAPQEEAQKDD